MVGEMVPSHEVKRGLGRELGSPLTGTATQDVSVARALVTTISASAAVSTSPIGVTGPRA